MAAKKKTLQESGKYNRAEMLVCEKKFNLSLDIQVNIRKKYKEYQSLLQLTKDVFQDPTLAEDSDEFKNTKNFVTRIHSGQEVHDFAEKDIDFIAENGPRMRPMDITRLLFPEIEGNPLKECKSVVAVLTALGIKYEGDDQPKEILGPYTPPTSDHKVIAMINKSDPDLAYHISKLDSEKKKKIAVVKKTLNNIRVVAMISAIRSKQHREVFESQLILSILDKESLTWEDIQSFANLANEYVRSLIITEEIALLNDRLAEATAEDEDSRKFTKSLSDSLSTKATEYNSCQNRMIKLHSELADTRANRLKHLGIVNESLAKYIELAKTDEGREYMLKLAKIRETQISDECKRIESLGDLVAEIRGISIEEILSF